VDAMDSGPKAPGASISPVLRLDATGGTRVAAVVGTDSIQIQAMFSELARVWQRGGIRVAGVVEEKRSSPGRVCADSVLHDLLNGTIYPISQNLGRGSLSCNLDSHSLAYACAAVESSVRSGCDLVVISKFGKQEAAGGGLVDAFRVAIEADIPVLTSVSAPWRPRWLAFSGSLSGFVAAEPRDIEAWWKSLKRCSS